MRLRTGLPFDTPTTELLRVSGQLSVQQLSAYHSLLQVYKVKKFRQPEYIFDRLFLEGQGANDEMRTSRSLHNNLIRIDGDLAIYRDAFFYRSSRLWNVIPLEIRNMNSIASFKLSVKRWIKQNLAHI